MSWAVARASIRRGNRGRGWIGIGREGTLASFLGGREGEGACMCRVGGHWVEGSTASEI